MGVLVGGRATAYSNRGELYEGLVYSYVGYAPVRLWSARPSIVVSSAVSISSGIGTLNSPYIISE